MLLQTLTRFLKNNLIHAKKIKNNELLQRKNIELTDKEADTETDEQTTVTSFFLRVQ